MRAGLAYELPGDLSEFGSAVVDGLSRSPRCLEARFLYDAEGSAIYEQITRQPEYYPTRAEDALLATCAGEIRSLVSGDTLVELGSGSSTKTRRLLDTGYARYLPIDVSSSALALAEAALRERYPDLHVEPVVATYQQGLAGVRLARPSLITFLGSSLGNLDDAQTDELLSRIARALPEGGAFLLGVDLVKDTARLEAAYNDAAGWTERFTMNMLARMNRELDCGIPADAARHVAVYNEADARIEIYAEFLRDLTVCIGPHRFELAAGERVQTEISRKYRPAQLRDLGRSHGLVAERSWTDGDVALVLYRRTVR